MEKRIGPAPFRNSMPLWAWYQWQSSKKKRPDLRFKGFLEKGEQGVLIEFEISDELVLLSDFELWHHVLNYWYLPSSKDDGEAFELELAKKNLSFYTVKPPPHFIYHKKIEKSWRRIFDLDWENPYLTSPRKEKSIQACFWKLEIKNVRNHKEFSAR